MNIFFTAVETDYSLKQVDKDGGVRADERWDDLQRGRQVKVPGGTLIKNGRSILQTGLGDTFGSSERVPPFARQIEGHKMGQE